MHIQTDRAFVPAATPSVRYLQVRITAPPAPASVEAPRPPVDVALVLDRSGSMGGSKIEMARTAVAHAIRQLAPADHLAVVCYDDAVDTLLGHTPASAEAKALALDRLEVTDARGSTDLAAGWAAGARELGAAAVELGHPVPTPQETRVKRVLLLTDGLANCGITDPEALAATAASLRAQGITTSTFGLGVDFDEALLSRLATAGGGRFYFIEQARQIPDYFASELGEALDVVARDAVFEITCTGAEPALVNLLPTEATPGGIRVRLGDLVADQELTFVVAVHVATPPGSAAQVQATCRVSDRGGVLFSQPFSVEWAVVGDTADEAQPVNQAVVQAFAVALAARAQAAALAHNRRDDFAQARSVLGEAIDLLTRLGADDPVIGGLIAELGRERDALAHALAPVEAKRRHFRNYTISASLDRSGKAQRRRKVS